MLVNGGASGMSADNERIETERFEGKDFGANGFRAGAMVCQHNDKLLSAIASKARPMSLLDVER
jgi:hypothetical protein